MEVIELEALLLSLLSILFEGEFLEITNLLCRRLSIFSTRRFFSALGNLLLLHLQINLDSWRAISSSSLRILRFDSLFSVRNGLMLSPPKIS
jgi:hypothetical protein